jgi:hypothetical protein
MADNSNTSHPQEEEQQQLLSAAQSNKKLASHDGVFANLAAKPEKLESGEKNESELPPVSIVLITPGLCPMH